MQRITRTAARFVCFVMLAALFAAAGTAQADLHTWDSGGSDDNFGSLNNWGGDTAPASGDSLAFGSGARTSPNNNLTSFSFAGITFNSGSPAFTIGGNSFDLTGDIVNNDDDVQTLNTPIVLSGAPRTVNADSGNITLGGAISGSQGLTKTGAGTLTLSGAHPVDATGGTISYSGGYKIHTFTADGTFTVSTGGDVEYLVVGGGGGGGGGNGGGGGAGGFRTGTGFAVTPQAYGITVGAGGAGGVYLNTPPYGTVATKGGDSSFSTITSTGGGTGGGAIKDNDGTGVNGGNGGSGGGGAAFHGTGTGGSGDDPDTTPDQGENGGAAYGFGPYNDGGGGGASEAGAAATSGGGGKGGDGTASSISGASVTYAGGGGGATESGTPGLGGAGGGGDASKTATGEAGDANTGGGGGGGGGSSRYNGGNGGSGIVIIRYLTYTGATAVNDGTLLVNNTSGSGTGSGAVTVGASGALRGIGTVGGAVSSTGRIWPGQTTGINDTFGTLTAQVSANPGGKVHTRVKGASATLTSDKLVMTGSGSISLAGAELQVSWIFDGSTYVSTTYIDLLDAGSVRITGAFGTLTAGTLPSGVAIVYRNAAGDVVTPSGDTPAQFVSLRVVSGSTPTAAEMLICAYAAAAGVVVEFRSIEEAGNNDMVLYLYRNGQWEEVGRQPSAGEGSHTYRFVVPGLSAGDIVNLMVRDDEGQHHTRNNVTVGRFAAEMLRMDQNVLALQWESLPGRTYDIQRAERLDGAWEPMQSVEAVQTQTVTTISVDPAKPTGFFRIGVRE